MRSRNLASDFCRQRVMGEAEALAVARRRRQLLLLPSREL
jgi:hypothetical protein